MKIGIWRTALIEEFGKSGPEKSTRVLTRTCVFLFVSSMLSPFFEYVRRRRIWAGIQTGRGIFWDF